MPVKLIKIVQRMATNKQGFVALIFVLVSSAVLISVTVAASLSSIQNLQTQLWRDQSERAYYLAYFGAEDGLWQLKNNWQNYNYSLLIDGNSSTINIETDANQAVVQSLGQISDYYRQIAITVSRDLKIISWEE